MLVTTEILRGDVKPGRIPVAIHYGLDLLVDGVFDSDGDRIDVTTLRPKQPKGIVEIVQGLGAGMFPVEDMRQDHLWFLRHPPPQFLPGLAARDRLGVFDLGDMQPLALREYYAAYLTDDPETRVRAWLGAHPGSEAGPGALRYLEHCEVERIRRDENPARRVERLLAHFRAAKLWGLRDEVREAIEASGETAGPYLVALLKGGDYPDRLRRPAMIEMLGKIPYAPAFDVITAILEAHDAEFAREMRLSSWHVQTLQQGPLAQQYSEVCAAALALGDLGDSRALPLLHRVEAGWAGQDGWGESVRERCVIARNALIRKPK